MGADLAGTSSPYIIIHHLVPSFFFSFDVMLFSLNGSYLRKNA